MAKDLKKAEYYDMYRTLLTEKQCEVMEMYYFSDLSLGEIAEETGSSRQNAFNCLKKSEERLEELERALGLVEKRGEIKEFLGKIKNEIRAGRLDSAFEMVEELDREI